MQIVISHMDCDDV